MGSHTTIFKQGDGKGMTKSKVRKSTVKKDVFSK